jgi:hypothetical protein
MKPPSSPFDSAQGRRAIRAYGRLLWLLRGRDPQEQRAIKEDAERLLDAARARGRGAFAATWLALMWDLVIVGACHDLARAFRSLVRAPGFRRKASSTSFAARLSWVGPSPTNEYPGTPSIASGRTGGRKPVLVLSHRLWQSLGADPALIGGTIYVEGRNWRVLGVMPADFAVPDVGAGFWTPWDICEAYRPRRVGANGTRAGIEGGLFSSPQCWRRAGFRRDVQRESIRSRRCESDRHEP